MLSPSEQSASWPRTLQMRAILDVLQLASVLLQPLQLLQPFRPDPDPAAHSTERMLSPSEQSAS